MAAEFYSGETTNGFKHEPYRFLSNMTPCKIIMYGMTFNSVENAYQASKCQTIAEMAQFIDINPYEAKSLGRKIKVRDDFEDRKLIIMQTLLRRKFNENNPELRRKLIATHGIKLVEHNYWRDEFWGVCNGVGQNHLGRLLMIVRNEVMQIISLCYKHHIVRQDLRDNPNDLFLFGDNDLRIGFGGQAKEMRGEPNACGIRTKYKPTLDDDAFWHDSTYEQNIAKINEDFERIFNHPYRIIMSSNGIGTGLARLTQNAPRTLQYLNDQIFKLHFTRTSKLID